MTSHAAVVARALGIPTVVQVERVTRDANAGDRIIVDGELGRVDLRPEGSILASFREKVVLAEQAREIYRTLRGRPATTADGVTVSLKMNAGVLADLPSIEASGAEGVGLYRTELQFMIRPRLPGREAQANLYRRVMDAARGREVVFRTLDIGSDKIVPYFRREVEPNPAMGWRAIRVGLDRPRLFRMQVQALVRAADGRPFAVMFPMVAEADEFRTARALVEAEVEAMTARGHRRPERLRIGFMLETPSLVWADDRLFVEADFVSVGGNDLMQFFYAADRENEHVRTRYDMLNFSFLRMLREVAARCYRLGTPLSFCGEAAGRPLEALALAAAGFRELSMRPAAIGPVKRALIAADLSEARAVLAEAEGAGATSARPALRAWAAGRRLPA
jgi:phosphotransferase system enzyme I (PtsP)